MILKSIYIVIIASIFSFVSCASDDPAYNPSSMPNFDAPGEVDIDKIPIHTVPKGEGPNFRYHRPGFKYPDKRVSEGGGFCVMCHGKDLSGADKGWASPPSCYTCHDRKWNEDGKENADTYSYGDPGTQSGDEILSLIESAIPGYTKGDGMPKYDPPLAIHSVPKPTPSTDDIPTIGDSDYRWHRQGFKKAMDPCSPGWTCRCCHGADDLTGMYTYPANDSYAGQRKAVEYIDPYDNNKVKYPPSCYTCHNRAWD